MPTPVCDLSPVGSIVIMSLFPDDINAIVLVCNPDREARRDKRNIRKICDAMVSFHPWTAPTSISETIMGLKVATLAQLRLYEISPQAKVKACENP